MNAVFKWISFMANIVVCWHEMTANKKQNFIGKKLKLFNTAAARVIDSHNVFAVRPAHSACLANNGDEDMG